ncbi:MAG: hypothetical protein ACKODX_00525 [Gemmata sp.]|jgi:hypothetical protein
MKRLIWLAALAFLTTGCSNAPVAGFLDSCFPSKARCDVPPVPDRRPVGDPVRPVPKSETPLPPPDFGPVVP